MKSENHQIIPVNDHGAGECALADGFGPKSALATGKLGPVTIANADDLAGGELACTSQNPGQQQALARVAQGLPGAVIHHKRPARMMKKSDPPFPSLQTVGLRHKQGPLALASNDPGQDLGFPAGGDHQRNARTHGNTGSTEFGGHTPDGSGAAGPARQGLQPMIDPLDQRDKLGIGLAEIIEHPVHRRQYHQ